MMKIKKINHRNQQGLSNLLLVFIVASLLTLVILILQLNSLLSARRAAQVQYSQTAFFAAEGALYQEIQNLRKNGRPDDLPLERKYMLGDTEIKVTIDQLDPEEGFLTITVQGDNHGAKRKLVASFFQGTKHRSPLDIVLAIDRSRSMEDFSLNEAKNAAKAFVDYENLIAGDRIATVSYSYQLGSSYHTSCFEAKSDLELTALKDNRDTIKAAIDNLTADGYTNIGHAINLATEELDFNGRSEAVKVIILLSDGVSNREHTNNSDDSAGNCSLYADDNYDDNIYACGQRGRGYPCFELGRGFEPDTGGTFCTEDAINQARIAKGPGKRYHIFSIFLENFDIADRRCTLEAVKELGKKTLKQIATNPNYFYETTKPEDLTQIYQEIAETATSPDFFEIREEVPEPESTPTS